MITHYSYNDTYIYEKAMKAEIKKHKDQQQLLHKRLKQNKLSNELYQILKNL